MRVCVCVLSVGQAYALQLGKVHSGLGPVQGGVGLRPVPAATATATAGAGAGLWSLHWARVHGSGPEPGPGTFTSYRKCPFTCILTKFRTGSERRRR